MGKPRIEANFGYVIYSSMIKSILYTESDNSEGKKAHYKRSFLLS